MEFPEEAEQWKYAVITIRVELYRKQYKKISIFSNKHAI